MGQSGLKKIFHLILTKHGVHIVRIVAVLKIKKIFEIFHFSDQFLSENIFRMPQSEKFFIQNFSFYPKYELMKVSFILVHAIKSWFLVLKLKIGACGFWAQGAGPPNMLPPKVTLPIGSWLGHVRNSNLSEPFYDIYHFLVVFLLIRTSTNCICASGG